jgi:hypothetical protein
MKNDVASVGHPAILCAIKRRQVIRSTCVPPVDTIGLKGTDHRADMRVEAGRLPWGDSDGSLSCDAGRSATDHLGRNQRSTECFSSTAILAHTSISAF